MENVKLNGKEVKQEEIQKLKEELNFDKSKKLIQLSENEYKVLQKLHG